MIRVGLKFQEARFKKRLTLEQVSEATRIRVSFLKAIEGGDYKKLPSSAYAYGFVRNYAKFLDLNESEAIALFKREFDAEKAFEVLPKSFSKKDDISRKRIRLGRNFLIGGGIFLFVIFFIFFQYKDAVLNPPLSLISPKEGETITSQDIVVSGKTDSNCVVYVENQLVSVNSDGSFKKVITVFPGKNAVLVKSTNRFGRTSELTKRIIVKSSY